MEAAEALRQLENVLLEKNRVILNLQGIYWNESDRFNREMLRNEAKINELTTSDDTNKLEIQRFLTEISNSRDEFQRTINELRSANEQLTEKCTELHSEVTRKDSEIAQMKATLKQLTENAQAENNEWNRKWLLREETFKNKLSQLESPFLKSLNQPDKSYIKELVNQLDGYKKKYSLSLDNLGKLQQETLAFTGATNTKEKLYENALNEYKQLNLRHSELLSSFRELDAKNNELATSNQRLTTMTQVTHTQPVPAPEAPSPPKKQNPQHLRTELGPSYLSLLELSKSQEQQLEQLEQENLKLSTELSDLQNSLFLTSAHLSGIEKALSQEKSLKVALHSELAQLQAKPKHHKHYKEQYHNSLNQIQLLTQDHSIALLALNTAVTGLSSENYILSNNLDTTTEQLRTAKEQWREESSALHSQLENHKLLLAESTLKDQVRTLAQALAESQRTTTSLNEQVQALQLELDAKEPYVAALRAQLAELSEEKLSSDISYEKQLSKLTQQFAASPEILRKLVQLLYRALSN